jgi:hypothetical protein
MENLKCRPVNKAKPFKNPFAGGGERKHSFAIAAKNPILFVGIADVGLPSVRNV